MPLQITKMFRKKYNQLLGDEVSEEVQSSMNNLEKAAEDFANGKDPDGSKFRKAQEQFFEVRYLSVALTIIFLVRPLIG